jgi:phage N-6-adenine-methyltransferase
MNQTAAFLSQRQDWETPQTFFDHFNNRYGFTLDACATAENAKCENYFTPEDNALTRRWAGVVWMNPPYGHGLGKWVEKAYQESRRKGVDEVVCLLPASTDTTWWHDYVMKARHIILIRGRLRFGGSSSNAPFPSCVVIFSRYPGGFPYFSKMDRILDAQGVTS